MAYTAGIGGESSMPACFKMMQKDRDCEQDPKDDWPEPPGYLGEAVRRAKLIPSRARPTDPPEASEG